MKIKSKTMYKIIGLEESPKNDENIYASLSQAELHSPTPAFLEKVEIIKLKWEA